MRKKAKKMSEILSEMTTMNYDTLKQYQQKTLEKIRTSDGDTKRKYENFAKQLMNELRTREEFSTDPTYNKELRETDESKNKTKTDEKTREVLNHNIDFSKCGFEKADALHMMGIYVLTSPNGAVFVGASTNKNLSNTLHSFIRKLNSGSYPNKELQEDWSRFGESSFTIEVPQVFEDAESAKSAKQAEIDRLNSNDIPCYNIKGNVKKIENKEIEQEEPQEQLAKLNQISRLRRKYK